MVHSNLEKLKDMALILHILRRKQNEIFI